MAIGDGLDRGTGDTGMEGSEVDHKAIGEFLHWQQELNKIVYDRLGDLDTGILVNFVCDAVQWVILLLIVLWAVRLEKGGR